MTIFEPFSHMYLQHDKIKSSRFTATSEQKIMPRKMCNLLVHVVIMAYFLLLKSKVAE